MQPEPGRLVKSLVSNRARSLSTAVCCAGGEGSQAEQVRHILVLEQ